MSLGLSRVLLGLAGALLLQAGRVHAVVEVGTSAADGTVPVTVRVVPTGIMLGSYQGTLRFTPGTLRVIQASAPRAGDATRLVNASDTLAGVLRFAGFTVTGFRQDTVLTLRVRPTRSIQAAELRATIDVAADSAGTRIPRDRLIPSSAGRPRP